MRVRKRMSEGIATGLGNENGECSAVRFFEGCMGVCIGALPMKDKIPLVSPTSTLTSLHHSLLKHKMQYLAALNHL